MTAEEFRNLRIGDSVIHTKEGFVKVIDINRSNGRLTTGGTWRHYRDVRLPVPEYELTPVVKKDSLTFPVRMLQVYGLLQSCILMAVREAGEDGFVGTIESLVESCQVFKSTGSTRQTILGLVHIGLIERTKLDINVYRFKLTPKAFQF